MSGKGKISFYPKNRGDIKWKVPSLFNNDNLVLTLTDYCKELGVKQPVNSVYGGVKSAWSGGRVSQLDEVEETKIYDILSEYNQRDISCGFTFSNYRIKEEDLEDKSANLLLKIASDVSDQNYAIVSSDILADYIRSKYPRIKLISSIIKPVYEHKNYDETPDYYNKLCERYDKVVVRPEFYFEKGFMKKLKHKKKIEIMANLGCLQRCPLASKHYDLTVEWDAGREAQYTKFCHVEMNNVQSVYKTTTICSEDIEDLIKLGFENFKLKGRGISDIQLMDSIGNFIFHPTGYFLHLEIMVFKKLGIY